MKKVKEHSRKKVVSNSVVSLLEKIGDKIKRHEVVGEFILTLVIMSLIVIAVFILNNPAKQPARYEYNFPIMNI